MRAFFLVLLLAAPSAHAQMYKCVDARGVTQYSDKPCPDGKGKEVDIRGQPPISGALKNGKDDVSDQDAAFRRRQIEREQADAREQRDRAARERRCAELKETLERMETARRVSTRNDKGERVFMDDAQRKARTDQLREQLRGCP